MSQSLTLLGERATRLLAITRRLSEENRELRAQLDASPTGPGAPRGARQRSPRARRVGTGSIADRRDGRFLRPARSTMEQIEARILDRIYKLQVPVQERDRLMQAVELVDRKMREIRDAGKAQGPDRIAVNAALQLVYEFLGRAAAATLVAGGMSADTTVAPDADPVDGGDQSDIGFRPEGSRRGRIGQCPDLADGGYRGRLDARGAGPGPVSRAPIAGPRSKARGRCAGQGHRCKGRRPRSRDAKGADLKRADPRAPTPGAQLARYRGKGTEGRGLDSKAIDSKGVIRQQSDGKRADPSSSAEVPAQASGPDRRQSSYRRKGSGRVRPGARGGQGRQPLLRPIRDRADQQRTRGRDPTAGKPVLTGRRGADEWRPQPLPSSFDRRVQSDCPAVLATVKISLNQCDASGRGIRVRPCCDRPFVG